MDSQLAFTTLLDEADETRQAALDRHRQRVQDWFDALPDGEKQRWAEWMTTYEWDTCVALSAAVGDWSRFHPSSED